MAIIDFSGVRFDGVGVAKRFGFEAVGAVDAHGFFAISTCVSFAKSGESNRVGCGTGFRYVGANFKA